ncbi:MAG: response regulator [Planctomycetaceae bacterium]
MVTVTNPKSVDADAAAQTYRALVVDDDAVARGVAIFALQNAGFDCDAAGDIEEALARIEIHAYDYIVTDLRMPGRHGYYLVQEVLARPRRPVLTVLTAVDESKIIKDLLTRGVDAVYIKPADYQSFAAEAKTLVARHQTGATENQFSHRASELSASSAVAREATQAATDEDDSPEAAGRPPPGGPLPLNNRWASNRRPNRSSRYC